MTRNSSPCRQRCHSLDGEVAERVRIVAAYMGLLVEQSIKKIDIGQIALADGVSPTQLRAELDATITVLAAQVEKIDGLALAADNVGLAERDHGLAILLSIVLRTWLDGEDPDLIRAVSALERAGAWRQLA
jgi:hypothetical protein